MEDWEQRFYETHKRLEKTVKVMSDWWDLFNSREKISPHIPYEQWVKHRSKEQ